MACVKPDSGMQMKASVFVGTSVDGFIARHNGDFDFLPAGGGEPHGYDEFMASVVQRFLQDGFIQRLVVTSVPVLIGEGIPLFGSLPHDVRLRHVSTTTYRSGLVKNEYEVLG
jgi:hypothetical protein